MVVDRRICETPGRQRRSPRVGVWVHDAVELSETPGGIFRCCRHQNYHPYRAREVSATSGNEFPGPKPNPTSKSDLVGGLFMVICILNRAKAEELLDPPEHGLGIAT